MIVHYRLLTPAWEVGRLRHPTACLYPKGFGEQGVPQEYVTPDKRVSAICPYTS